MESSSAASTSPSSVTAANLELATDGSGSVYALYDANNYVEVVWRYRMRTNGGGTANRSWSPRITFDDGTGYQHRRRPASPLRELHLSDFSNGGDTLMTHAGLFQHLRLRRQQPADRAGRRRLLITKRHRQRLTRSQAATATLDLFHRQQLSNDLFEAGRAVIVTIAHGNDADASAAR